MSIGYRRENGIEVDSLGALGLSGAAVAPDMPASSPLALNELDDLLQEADGRTVPDATALWTSFRRTLVTLAPIVIADLLSLAAAGFIAQMIFAKLFPGQANQIGGLAALALLPLVLAYWLGDLYSQIWVHPVVELRQLTRINLISIVAAAAGGLLAHPILVWCAAALPGVMILVPIARAIARRLASSFSGWGFPTLVIAPSERVSLVTSILLDVPGSGLRPVLLTDPSGHCKCSILPVINDPATLQSMVRSKHIRHAVLTLPERGNQRTDEFVEQYTGLVPHLLVLSDCATLPTLWGASRDFGRLNGNEVRNGLMLATLRSIKRAIDLAVSVVALAIAFPLMLAIGLMIKICTPGPIFYGHKRIGKHGRFFTAWKFRTMHVHSDEILRQHLQENPAAREEWLHTHKLRDDPRVGWLGRFLRRSSLDELPQIWNVLKGDMSLVGPRPIVTDEVRRYGESIRLYAAVKPGITGLWQVSGRNNVGYVDRVILDMFYIRHWSPWLDVYILAKTVIALISQNGAY
jgi:Undecaprenyl-phosphate galactose phosphotransferase WbaP